MVVRSSDVVEMSPTNWRIAYRSLHVYAAYIDHWDQSSGVRLDKANIPVLSVLHMVQLFENYYYLLRMELKKINKIKMLLLL